MDKEIKEEKKAVEIIRNFEFEKICKLKQMDLKLYVFSKLIEFGYDVISEDGFVYAKGTEPVMLLAHMDTVHKVPVEKIQYFTDSSRILSPQGIGGDDRCGIYMILEIIKEHKCSVLFTEDEEIGCVGARKFVKTDYVNNLGANYMIEFDRKGKNDAVFYSCDNKDFTKFITNGTGLIKSYGSCSDISQIAPASKIAAVNLSCGYYQAHTVNEYVVFEEMYNIIKTAKEIIQKECTVPFEYIEEVKYNYKASNRYSEYDDYYGYGYSGSKTSKYGEKLYRKNNKKNFILEFLLYIGINTDGSNSGNEENSQKDETIVNQENAENQECDSTELTEEDTVKSEDDDVITVYTVVEALTEEEALGFFFKRFQQHCYTDIVSVYVGDKPNDSNMLYIDSFLTEEKPPIEFVVGDLINYEGLETYNKYLYTNGKIISIDAEKREAVCCFGLYGTTVKTCDIEDLTKRDKPLDVGDLVKVINSDDVTNKAVIEGDILEVKLVYQSGVSLAAMGSTVTTYSANGGVELFLSKADREKSATRSGFYFVGDLVDCKIPLQKKDSFETKQGIIVRTYEYGAEVEFGDNGTEFLLFSSIELSILDSEVALDKDVLV